MCCLIVRGDLYTHKPSLSYPKHKSQTNPPPPPPPPPPPEKNCRDDIHFFFNGNESLAKLFSYVIFDFFCNNLTKRSI